VCPDLTERVLFPCRNFDSHLLSAVWQKGQHRQVKFGGPDGHISAPTCETSVTSRGVTLYRISEGCNLIASNLFWGAGVMNQSAAKHQ
jgi:hypothetical protein